MYALMDYSVDIEMYFKCVSIDAEYLKVILCASEHICSII